MYHTDEITKRSGITSRGTVVLEFVYACAVSLELKFIPHSWEKMSHRVNLRAGTAIYSYELNFTLLAGNRPFSIYQNSALQRSLEGTYKVNKNVY